MQTARDGRLPPTLTHHRQQPRTIIIAHVEFDAPGAPTQKFSYGPVSLTGENDDRLNAPTHVVGALTP